ncbi:hypothetical protein CHISP_2352 [Chitinispirillum alkaliphilum]|nr:hypothetical protein CHISP_2352 [Chitinispirillum alkaliphilum]
MKIKTRLPVFITFVLLFHCSEKPVAVLPVYNPPAVFSGYVNGVYTRFSGNRRWPNRAMLIGDTLRFYFYTDEFSEVFQIREGDLLRVDVWPGNDGPVLGNETLLVNMSRYCNSNATYTVHPSMPLSQGHSVRMEVRDLIRSSGESVHIENIYVRTRSVGANAPELEISDGTIKGEIE